eukprot:scaffold79219_cov45-Phaeocystis_antarctica.AAC.1
MQQMVISKICTNCKSEILGEFLGVNVPFPAREGGCPPPVTVCEKASPKTNFLWFNLPLKTHKGDKCDLVQDMSKGWRSWSSGMSLALSARSPGFEAGMSPFRCLVLRLEIDLT